MVGAGRSAASWEAGARRRGRPRDDRSRTARRPIPGRHHLRPRRRLGPPPDTDTTAVPVADLGRSSRRPRSDTPRPSRMRWVAAGVLIALVIGITGARDARPHRARRPRRSCSATSRPTASPTASSASTCPATSARRSASSCRSSRASPIRRRSRPSSTRSSIASISRGHRRQADVHQGHQAVVRRPARVRDRTDPDAAATPRERSASDARALMLLSVKDAALAQAWFTSTMQPGRRDRHDRDVQRHHAHRVHGPEGRR